MNRFAMAALALGVGLGGCKVDPVEPPPAEEGGGNPVDPTTTTTAGGGEGLGGGGAGAGGDAGGMPGTGGTGGTGGGGTGGAGGAPPVPTYDEIAYATGMRMLTHEGGTFYSVRYADALGQNNTYVATSTDGVTWTPTVRVDDIVAGNAQRGSVVAWDDGGAPNVGTLWMHRGVTPQEVRFSRSTDGAASFGTSTVISADGGNDEVAGTLARGIDGSLWTVFTTKPNGQIVASYVSRSLDDGATWSTPSSAFDEGGFAQDHSIVAGGAGEAWIGVATNDHDIVVYRTSDASTWTGSVVNFGSLANQTQADYPYLLRLADGTLWITYDKADGNNEHDIFVAKSTDGGATWGSYVQVNEAVTTQTINASGSHPSLAAGGSGRLYAVWSDDRTNPIGDNHDIYLSYSTDGGVTWSADILVNDMPSVFYQRHASIAVVPGVAQDTVVVTWSDQRSPYYEVRSAALTLP